MCPLNISDEPPLAPAPLPTPLARAAPRPRPRPEHVGAAVLDLLPLDLEAELLEGVDHEDRHRLLAAGEAGDRDRLARPVDEPAGVERDGPQRTPGTTRSPKSRICSCRRSPQSSSITCVQPASRYSSIAAMQSSGVPAIGLPFASSAPVP